MKPGEVFTYNSLDIPREQSVAAAKVLSRLVQKGEVNRYKKGIFYIPNKTVFGELKPREEALLENYLFENNRQVAYVTGNRLYNKMGLTTQVPNVIKLASRDKKIRTTIGGVQLKPVKSYVAITKSNIPLLQLLDVIKDFKNIPDLDKNYGLKFLKARIQSLSARDKEKLAGIAEQYPPKVRALLGAILESLSLYSLCGRLRNFINPLSSYEYGLIEEQLPEISNWNIS